MSSVTRLTTKEARLEQASLWIAKMDRGLSIEEERQLCDWMAENKENRSAVLEMAAQWDKMDSLSRLAAMFPHQPAGAPASKNRSGLQVKLSSWITPITGPAFALSLMIAVSAYFVLQPVSEPELTQDILAYETAVGEQSSILLPDGSHMRLNTDSFVEVDFSLEERRLILTRGELNIDVAHDASRPLRVEANGRIVEAVGTAFNVEITEDQEVELVVTDGKVVVTLAQNTNAAIVATTSRTPPQFAIPQEPISVSAGHQIILGSENEELIEIEPQEALVKLSWREGNLVFRGESLEEAMTEVARYTTVEFIFLDEKSKSIRVAGLFKAGDTTNLLSALRENFNVTHEWDGSDRVLLSSL